MISPTLGVAQPTIAGAGSAMSAPPAPVTGGSMSNVPSSAGIAGAPGDAPPPGLASMSLSPQMMALAAATPQATPAAQGGASSPQAGMLANALMQASAPQGAQQAMGGGPSSLANLTAGGLVGGAWAQDMGQNPNWTVGHGATGGVGSP